MEGRLTPALFFSSHLKCQLLAATLIAAFIGAEHLVRAQTSRAPASNSTTITVTGFLNACYRPNKWQVWMTGFPPNNFESPTYVVGRDGRFTFTLDADKVKPGDYGLHFGYRRAGAGFYRFTIKSRDVNLGEIGECDV
jgi:hypothetical protein